MDAASVVDRYFKNMRERNLDGLMALFGESATFVLPDGRALSGTAAIRGMYTHLFAGAAPSPTPQAVITGASGAAVEIETRIADGSTRRTANFFHLDDTGQIERLSVYMRNG